MGDETGVEDDEEDVGVLAAGSGFETSCGDGADDFRLLPRFSWLSERGKRARKVGAVTVVGTEIVTLEAAVVMIDMSDCVELCLGEKNRVLAVMEQKITKKAGSRREQWEIGHTRHDTST